MRPTDYDCPHCSWSLHVEPKVWDSFPNIHSEIVKYIEHQIVTHMDENHGVENDTHLFKVSNNIQDYKTPYLYYSGQKDNE